MDINNFDPKNPPSDFNVDMGLDWYVNELVKQKTDFNDLDSEVLDQIKKDLKPRIESFVNISILKNVPEEKLEAFEKILEGNDPIQIQDFCSKNIPDLNQIIAVALADFRDSYINASY